MSNKKRILDWDPFDPDIFERVFQKNNDFQEIDNCVFISDFLNDIKKQNQLKNIYIDKIYQSKNCLNLYYCITIINSISSVMINSAGERDEYENNEIILFGFIRNPEINCKILIKPESISDKIMDLFIRKDIDFDTHEQLSDKYFITSNNKSLAKKFLNSDILNLLNDHNDLVVDLSYKYIVTRSAVVGYYPTKSVYEFTKELTQHLKLNT